jgi:hypothetical protein
MATGSQPPKDWKQAMSGTIDGGSVPNPDPTIRTVEQVARDILASREIMEGKVARVEEKIETRLAGMDKGIELLQKWRDDLPAAIKATVNSLHALQDEKFVSIEDRMTLQFAGIQTQFIERDKRTEQLSLADKTAVAAALQAQKESAASTDESNRIANTKMETNFTKLIEQTQILLQQNTKTTDDKINDIKSRLDKGEGRSTIADPAMASGLVDIKALLTSRDLLAGHAQGTKDYTMLIVAVGGFVITIIPVLLLLLKTFGHG